MTQRQIISADSSLDLGSAVGAPVSPAVRANGFLYVSGYVSMDPKTGKLEPGSIEHETQHTLQALERVLETGGSSLEKVVKINIFLADIERDFDGMNKTYKKFFKGEFPARRTVQAKLVHDLKVEIDAVALV